MSIEGAATLGISLILVGLVFVALIFLVLRAAPRIQPAATAAASPITVNIPASKDAVIVIQTGGRVLYTNRLAREWFGETSDEEPNLERLSRRTRPSETFLGLCASEGQARFTIENQVVEGTSYRVPYGGNGSAGSAVLVSLRRYQPVEITPERSELSNEVLAIFAEFSHAMAASLDLESTLQAILESVERLVLSDFCEITVWDASLQSLVPYRFVGVRGVDRHLEQAVERYTPGSGYSGYLITNRTALLINNVDAYRAIRPQTNRNQYPFNAYCGVPLLVAGEILGTLELASLAQNAFTDDDLSLLRILSGQAGVALHNALLFRGEQDRVKELGGLAKMAHAIGAARDPQSLFAGMVESIKPLLDVKSLGFLIYNENRRILEAQVPFVGIPDQTIGVFRVPIDPGSPAERVWFSQERIVSLNAPEDERLLMLGLAPAAVAAGITHMALVPLSTSGRPLGYLQIGDKTDGTPFNPDDLRLVEIIAGQAAIIIENATLVQQTQERAQRSEALRRIASLAGSVATLDEILHFSLRELAQLLRADVAVIFLLDENRGELRIHSPSLFSPNPEKTDDFPQVSLDDPAFRSTVTGSRKPYFSGEATLEEQLPFLYRSIIETYHQVSLLVVPLIIRERGVGEIVLGSRMQDFFHQSDLTLVSTTASQLTVAIEKSILTGQTDDSLRQRVDHLTALTRISRELNATYDLQSPLQLVYDELLRTTQAHCGTILLFDLESLSKDQAKISHSIGDKPWEELTPLQKYVFEKEQPTVISDFLKPIEALENRIVEAPHDVVRSGMYVPILYQGHTAGLIELHGRTVDLFDEAALEIAQTLAMQAAMALGNAHRYQEQLHRSELLNRRVETLGRLLEASRSVHIELPLEQSLEMIAYGIQESTPFSMVLINVYDPQSGNLIRVAGAGIPLESFNDLRAHPPSWAIVQQLFQPEFRVSNSYFIPHDKRPFRPADLHIVTFAPILPAPEAGANAWHSDDLLGVPLYNTSGEILGFISVDAPRNGLRPDRPTIESLEIFASQAVYIIESTRKLQELTSRANNVQRELEKVLQSTQSIQEQLPILLHKDIEQTIAIQRLNQRARRIRAGMDIAEIVNRQNNRPNVLLALGQEILTRLEMDISLVAEPSTGGPRLLHALGDIPSQVNPEAFLGQRNPLRQVLQTGESILVPNLDLSNEWKSTPLLQALEAKAFLCLPIKTEQGIDSVLLAISSSALAAITPEEEQLYSLMTRQVAIALENLRLLTETNRRLQEMNLLLEFSRQLGSLDASSIIGTLAESAMQVVSVAQAVMVALWKPDEQLLAPQVALGYVDNQRILGIPYHSGEALPGQAFDQGQALLITEVNFAKQYNLPPEALLRYRDATAGRLPISCLVVPIQTLENKLGVLVLDNFKDVGAFSEDDQALVVSLAQQTALALENARLFQSAEQRTGQLQALTNVAATITSSLQTDELIASLLDQVKTVLPYETGTLWLRQGNQTTIRAARGFEDSEERVGLSVAVEDSVLLREMINTGRPIAVADIRQDERFPALMETRYLSWLGAPLIVKGEVVGVIALEKSEANFYNPERIQTAMTFSGQAAVALENANLFQESSRRALELDQRSQRLALLNRLSTELSGSLDPAQILKVAIEELVQAIGCSGGSALLFDDAGQPFLEAETPQTAKQFPIALPEVPLLERLRESQGVFISEDATQERELAPLSEYLQTQARAFLMLPLATGNEVHGVLMAHRSQVYRFSTDEVELARTIANQVAVAIQNARLFEETQKLFGETRQHSAELALLFEMGVSISQTLDQRQLMDATFDNVIRLTHSDAVMVAILDEDNQFMVDGLDQGERIGPIPWQRTGNSFSEFVLDSGKPFLIRDTQKERENLPVSGESVGAPVRCWLGIPLIVRGAVIGVISIQSYQPDSFGESHQRLLTQVANQLAISLDNARLLLTAQNYAADLEHSVSERTEQLAREHRRTQTLLGIITELSTSLDLDLVLNRTLRVINDTIGCEHSLIMLVNPDETTLQLRASLGYTAPVPKGGIVSSMKLNEGLAGWVIVNRQATLIPDLWGDRRWVRRGDQTELHRSAIAVPLVIGEENLGALLLYHRSPNFFTPDQLELVQATAKQIAVALNNAQLFRLIRDQAERLGDMLRTQHIEMSRSQAILEAVADGVLVTDAYGKITLYNDSAEKILGLSRSQALGQSLEYFLGLFGRAGQSWVETIRLWSEDPTTYKAGDAYVAQIELDNSRVVAVSLAPVRLRNDFMGTVSIFRDITHMVEVDRLKSEFVATVSHELRTPMTSIKGYVEIMLMGAAGELSEQQTHFLQIVKSNTERLAILVNDLLDISRIEAGRSTLSFQPLDVADLIGKSVNDLKRRMEEENHSMQVDIEIAAELPSAYGDAERVRQIIDNLLENAYQYTPLDEGEPHIWVRAHQDGNEIQIDVKDNGIGVSAEDQKRVFERFYRGEDPLVLATSGTGLGLSIVQHLVEMHSGRIWLESSGVRGEGSAFSFTLPLFEGE